MKSFRHILVPLDHEAHSREALEYAVAIATRFGSEIGILHGDCDARDFGGETTVVLITSDRVPTLAEKLRGSEGSTLHALVAELEDVGAPQRGITVDAADSAIAILAAAQGADLIVIGSHGRKGAPRLVHGSVAETVARSAPCPVMIVRASEVDPPSEP